MAHIYKITSPSGKVYVGQSTNIKTRWESYKKMRCEAQTKLYKSFLKYTVENHIFEIIEECAFEELNIRERYWQDFYEVIDRKKGLNLLLTKTEEKPKVVSEETKQKQSVAAKNKKLPDGYQEKMQEMRDNGEGMNLRYTLIDTQTQKVFYGLKTASESIGVTSPYLSRIFKDGGENRTNFILLEDYESTKEYPVKDLRMLFSNKKCIINTITKTTYSSIAELAKLEEISTDKLGNMLSGRVINKTDYIYLSKYDESLEYNIKNNYVKKDSSKKVIDLKTLEIYESVEKLSNNTDYSSSHLSNMLNGKSTNKTNYMYLEHYDSTISYEIKDNVEKWIPKKVTNIKTGETIDSVRKAAEQISCSIEKLRKKLNGVIENDTVFKYKDK